MCFCVGDVIIVVFLKSFDGVGEFCLLLFFGIYIGLVGNNFDNGFGVGVLIF